MRTALLGLFLLAPSAFALEPKDVIVVANKNVPESREVAEYYHRSRLNVFESPTPQVKRGFFAADAASDGSQG